MVYHRWLGVFGGHEGAESEGGRNYSEHVILGVHRTCQVWTDTRIRQFVCASLYVRVCVSTHIMCLCTIHVVYATVMWCVHVCLYVHALVCTCVRMYVYLLYLCLCNDCVCYYVWAMQAWM